MNRWEKWRLFWLEQAIKTSEEMYTEHMLKGRPAEAMVCLSEATQLRADRLERLKTTKHPSLKNWPRVEAPVDLDMGVSVANDWEKLVQPKTPLDKSLYLQSLPIEPEWATWTDPRYKAKVIGAYVFPEYRETPIYEEMAQIYGLEDSRAEV